MGSKGDSYDNALAETINGLYKAELIHRRAPWKTKEAVELATLEWVSWFNHHRLLEPIGYIPPAEAEANYYRQLAVRPPLRHDLNQPASTIPGAVQFPVPRKRFRQVKFKPRTFPSKSVYRLPM